MGAIDDFAVKESKQIDSLGTAIAELDKAIQEFDDSPGVLTPNDQALLTVIRTRSAALMALAHAP